MSSTPATHSPEEPLSPVDSNDGEDLGPPQTSTFLRHVSETTRQSHCVSLDHLYTRSWSSCRSDSGKAHQTRLLLVNPLVKPDRQYDNAYIDVESVEEPANLTEPDEAAARAAMLECQEHVAGARDVPDDLIEQLDQSSWSAPRRQLLRQVLSALTSYQLARRALQGRRGAAFAARAHADRCAARVRRALAAAGWQRPLCQWLHTLLLQKLGKDLLALYLEVLQTLSSKVPSLVCRLTSASGTGRHGPLSAEALTPLLRRPWDPAAPLLCQHRLKRLPGNPLLVLVPSSPCHGADTSPLGDGTSRRDFWHRQLSALGKVVPISECEGGAPVRGISVSESLSHILSTSRLQVSELRRPGRPVVLLGWGAAGLVAAHLALVEPVSAVVCLGFPVWSPAGQRGTPEDPLLELRTPCLLLAGQAALDAAPPELERLRDRMRAETGLVVVGGADGRLVVNGKKRQREGLTQNMVDRAILEEVSEFLSGVLTAQVEGRRPLYPRLPTPPLQRQEGPQRTPGLPRDKRRRTAGATTVHVPPPQTRRRGGRQLRPGRPKKVRTGPPSTRPEPEPESKPAAPAGSMTVNIAPPASDSTTSAAPAVTPAPTVTPSPSTTSASSITPATSIITSTLSITPVVTPVPSIAPTITPILSITPAIAITPTTNPVPSSAAVTEPVIDLIQEVEAEPDVDVDVDVEMSEPESEPELMVTSLRMPPGQMERRSVRIMTNPPFKPQSVPRGPQSSAFGGRPASASARSVFVGGRPRQPRGAVRPGRAGKILSQREDGDPAPRRGRGRGRSRRGPQYGVAHEFGASAATRLGGAGTSATLGSAGTTGVQGSAGTSAILGSAGTTGVPGSAGTSAILGSAGTTGVLGSTGTSGVLGAAGTGVRGISGTTGVLGGSSTTGVSPAATGRPQTTGLDRPDRPAAPQQLVYVTPPGGARVAAPTSAADRLVVVGGGRQVVVSRGRARTVTYVPSPRPGALHRPPGQQYAAGQTRLVRTAVFPRPGRPQLHGAAAYRAPPRPGWPETAPGRD